MYQNTSLLIILSPILIDARDVQYSKYDTPRYQFRIEGKGRQLSGDEHDVNVNYLAPFFDWNGFHAVACSYSIIRVYQNASQLILLSPILIRLRMFIVIQIR